MMSSSVVACSLNDNQFISTPVSFIILLYIYIYKVDLSECLFNFNEMKYNVLILSCSLIVLY